MHVTDCPHKQTELKPTAPEEILPPSTEISQNLCWKLQNCADYAPTILHSHPTQKEAKHVQTKNRVRFHILWHVSKGIRT